jgi:transcriptional regulator with XRE-family HTH domain
VTIATSNPPRNGADMAGRMGSLIRDRRKALGLTLAGLGGRLGCSHVAVHYWERGNNMPGNHLVVPLCKALGITLNDLFGWEETP